MAYGNNAPRISVDRFNNPYQLKTLVQKTDKKTGELVDAYAGYVELGGKLYKVEVSNREKEMTGKNEGKAGMWFKITHVKKNARPSSM